MKAKFFPGAFLAVVLMLQSGCALLVVGAAAGAGVGTYAYVDGELKQTDTVSYDTAYNATLAAMKDYGYAVVDNQKDAVTAKITARSTSDKRIYVTLIKQSPTSTEIRIRVGTFGDKDQSEQILTKIKSHY